MSDHYNFPEWGLTMLDSDLVVDVRGLKTFFFTEVGTIRAVNDVSFSLFRNNVMALVGESGCGKSVTALSLLRLIPSPPGKIMEGEVFFESTNLLSLTESELNNIRGDKISMIFQDPMTALNPVFTVGDQIAEAILHHRKMTRKEVREYVLELLAQVKIPSPERVYESYPHQLSGGMRQRALIAMAISCHPRLLIADEPTTALDVTVQAHILQLLKDLQDKTGLSILFITHDLRVVAEIADIVAVMYAGKIIEQAPVHDLFDSPLHPYTQALMNSIPGIGLNVSRGERKRLNAIPGTVPNLLELPAGCAFHPRCPRAISICRSENPPIFVHGKHRVRCWLYSREILSQ